LRQAGSESGATVLLYEGGEASRFDKESINVGRYGVLRVLAHLGMTDEAPPVAAAGTLFSRRSTWSRAAKSGILHLESDLGSRVEAGQPIATIVDPFGKRLGTVKARHGGVVIGHTQRPLVNQGDAVAHIAET
jgi:predicted deacylase